MQASPLEQRSLLVLQELDDRLAVLARERRQEDAAERRRDLETLAMDLRRELATATGELEDAQSEVARYESDVAVARERLDRDRARLAESSNAKEAVGLEHEMDTLVRRMSALEDAELDVMQRVEDAEKVVGEISDRLSVVEAQRASFDDETAEQASVIDAEIAELGKNRRVCAAALPPELVSLYEKQRERYGIGAAELIHGVSLGSGTRLGEVDLDTIRRSPENEVILCPDSSCILIRGEESWT